MKPSVKSSLFMNALLQINFLWWFQGKTESCFNLTQGSYGDRPWALQHMGHFTLDEFKVLECLSHTRLSMSTLLTVQCKHFHPMTFIIDSGGQGNVFSNVTWNPSNLATLTTKHPIDTLQTTVLEPQPRVPFLLSCNWSILISRTYLFWGALWEFY